MTGGAPYPHPNPAPGSNAIGTFTIGISPLGDISQFDMWTTVLSQYANSDRLMALISSFNAALDMTENYDNLYDFVWNVLTAQGYGLDVWGRIVGVDRTLHFPSDAVYLGLEEANSWVGFGQGIFYSGGGTSNNFVLSDDSFRRLILAKAAGNISSGSIQAINSILLALFPGRGACYVADNQDMSLTYTFAFSLSAIDLAIIELSGVMPSPAGVVVKVSSH